MANIAQTTALRPLGAMELNSSVRHHLGVYRTVVLTGRYVIPQSYKSDDKALETAITNAVITIVNNEPMLRVGILGQDTPKATFSHIKSINVANHIEFRDSSSSSEKDYEAEVSKTHGDLNDQLFPTVDTQPPWKVVVVKSQDTLQKQCIDVFYAFHHSLSDGSGGKHFHQELVTNLNNPLTGALDPILSFPETPVLPECQEEAVPWKNGYFFLGKAILGEVLPSFLKPKPEKLWAGSKIDFSLPYKTLVHPIDLSAEVMASLLKASREHNSTLTTLLHGLILASLSRRLPEDQLAPMCSSTPISLRPFLSPNSNESLRTKFRTLVTTLDKNHSKSAILALRNAPTIDTLVWEAAARFRTLLKNRTSTLPIDDLGGLLSYISDFMAFIAKKDGTERATSWEVSNVGVMNQGAGGEWRAERLLFTNPSMVTGPAIGFNMASVQGGGLTIGVGWQDGTVESELMEGVVGDVERWMKTLHEKGTFEG